MLLLLTLKRQECQARLCGLLAGARHPGFAGRFLASGLVSFPGLVGGSVSEEGVAGGGPAGPAIGEVADDQGGFAVAGVVGGADGLVFGAGVLGAAVADPGG